MIKSTVLQHVVEVYFLRWIVCGENGGNKCGSLRIWNNPSSYKKVGKAGLKKKSILANIEVCPCLSFGGPLWCTVLF